MATTVNYTSVNNLVTELGLTTDNSGNYFIWQIPTSSTILQNYVTEANQYTTALWGDLSSSPNSFNLASMYATKWAALRLIQMLATNWQISGLTITIGEFTLQRLEALRTAAEAVAKRLEADLVKLYTLLATVDAVNAYQPASVYQDTRGTAFWPILLPLMPFLNQNYIWVTILTVGMFIFWSVKNIKCAMPKVRKLIRLR